MSPPLKTLALCLTLLCATAQAASDVQARNEKMKPKGPVTVTADRAELDKNGSMIYTGNVLLVSDNLQLKGDRLELKQYPGDQYEAKVDGTLAHMEHSGETDDKGQPLPPMMADGEHLLYDTRSGVIDITGKAKATRGKNEANGNSIRYNVSERRVQVASGDGKQVRIIFQPGEKQAPAKPRASRSKTIEKRPVTVAPAPGENASAPVANEAASTPTVPSP